MAMYVSTGNIPYFCEVGLKISGGIPIKAKAGLHFPNESLTSVTLGKTEKHTVAFLGTKNGYIKKQWVLVSSTAEVVTGRRFLCGSSIEKKQRE
ncbi:hypothetical protein RUM44_006360 [Polyplax serrata]|uniref:Uncharacterized protein n=1 Tax=Polyplax serrata TaxID=468196 RepID=A0ABR1AIL2_POLSC